MPINCSEHRKTLELLSLKIKLEKGINDPDEKKDITRRIAELEGELKLS